MRGAGAGLGFARSAGADCVQASGAGSDLGCFFPERQFRPGYTRLSPTEKTAYEAILQGYANGRLRIAVQGVAPERIEAILATMRCDIPELFWVKECVIEFSSWTSHDCTLAPVYRFERKAIRSMLEAMDIAADKLKRSIRCFSEIERQKAVHDYLVGASRYADAGKGYAHEACGPLLYGVGVCEGIAKAYKYLCDRCGLKSSVVVGWAEDQTGSCAESGAHAWNITEIGGVWYHQDATFDTCLSTGGAVRYDYFNLSDCEIVADHRFDRAQYPPCGSGFGYYRKEGLFASSKRELEALVQREYRIGKTLVFQVPLAAGHELVSEKQIMRIVADAVPALQGQKLSLSVESNRSTGVYQVTFEALHSA